MMTATYSPEDNKLRLYSATRLDAELYARVRALGFIFAPKQDLFVAPMWTPARADFLEELCGEIGDEDTGLVDRAEERAERFGDYSESRKADADQAHEAVHAIADGIPLGQPILVGHHSERHARKDAERIENGMRRAVKMWETAKYWQQRAAGAIRHAKYKERPDVRARRIKGLEADKRKHERERDKAAHWLKLWSVVHLDDGSGLRRKDGTPSTMHERAVFLANGCGLYAVATGEGGPWSAWDVLRPDGERYSRCPSMTAAEVQAIALRSYPATIAYCERWVAHLENRLAYERAMLGESGGTAADKVGPEKGGACRCWATARGASSWSYIQKVNKVSVTVLDNWGNGGGFFTRNIAFDKLTALMGAADVQAARDTGMLVHVDQATFVLRNALVSEDQAPAPAPAPADPVDGAAFDLMREALREGVKVVTAPQLFPTPPELAARMVGLAELEPGHRILEPSAGTGALLKAIGPGHECIAVEINAELALGLQRWGEEKLLILRADFLGLGAREVGPIDRVLMNPPFERGADIEHIKHAAALLKEDGLLVALCANGPRQRAALMPICDSWEDLPAGTFKGQGTGVNVSLLTIRGGGDYE
jgi:protein-L-isoaspartate O-methyltransferase